MRGPRKSTSLHGVLTLDFDPTKFQLDKRKEMIAKDSVVKTASVFKRLGRYMYNFVMCMLCCILPISVWIFGGEGQLLLLGGGLEGTQVHSGKVRSGVERLRYLGGFMV